MLITRVSKQTDFHLVRIFNSDYQKKVYVALNLSIAYASSIGGYGTLIGSGPPLFLKGIVEKYGTTLCLLNTYKHL